MRSSLEIYDMASATARVRWQTEALIEAPNWAPDGKRLLFNGGGELYWVDAGGTAGPVKVDTGFARGCNNDHGISPDGRSIVISDNTRAGRSAIYILPAGGGEPRPVTELTPSYWHGWSPDGATLAFCGQRHGVFDIYTIPADGGAEQRLTGGEGHNDGPDYSPDGAWIYFNSSRTGRMQVWRVRPDGTGLSQITFDEACNWFPHPSPTGTCILFLSYAPDVEGHPRDRDVSLRLMDMDGGNVAKLFDLFGGQGTINVPNWAPDGSAFAFVRYEAAE